MSRPSSVRIRGLVAARKRLEQEIASGVPSGVEVLSNWRTRVLSDVRRLLEAAGGTPDDLPLPSRRALRAIESMDQAVIRAAARAGGASRAPRSLGASPSRAPRGASGSRADVARSVSLPGVGQAVKVLVAAIRNDGIGGAEVATRCAREDARVRELGAGSSFPASAIPIRTRRAWGWLALHADPDRAEELVAWTRALDLELARCGVPESGVAIEACSDLWRLTRRRGHLRVTINVGLVHAGRDLASAMVRVAVASADPAAERLLQAGAERPGFREAWQALEALTLGTAAASETRGTQHDLLASYQRVRELAGDGDPAPRLEWTARGVRRFWGVYDRARDRIAISSRLDAPDVPAFVLDFVVYHEVLHRVLGVERGPGGRRVVHPPHFREAERKYPRWQEAERILRDLDRGV